ncbi:unnamed protein product [Urochloa humidicola]
MNAAEGRSRRSRIGRGEEAGAIQGRGGAPPAAVEVDLRRGDLVVDEQERRRWRPPLPGSGAGSRRWDYGGRSAPIGAPSRR